MPCEDSIPTRSSKIIEKLLKKPDDCMRCKPAKHKLNKGLISSYNLIRGENRACADLYKVAR